MFFANTMLFHDQMLGFMVLLITKLSCSQWVFPSEKIRKCFAVFPFRGFLRKPLTVSLRFYDAKLAIFRKRAKLSNNFFSFAKKTSKCQDGHAMPSSLVCAL